MHILKKYQEIYDLCKKEESFIVDLKELDMKSKLRVIDFLSGLTFRHGLLKKISADTYLFSNYDMELFQTKCSELIEKLKNEYAGFKINVEKNESGYAKSRSQYDGVVFWYRVMFNKSFEYKEKNIIGFHIMPYQIKIDDIKNAVDSNNSKPFNEEVIKDTNYVDYDSTSGNFHKSVDYNFQIVLIDDRTKGHYGAGYTKESLGKKTITDMNAKKYIKELIDAKVYYPNINQKSITTYDSLEKKIELVLKELGIIGK